MHYRRLDPVLRQFPAIVPRPARTQHDASPDADGTAAARAYNDASATASRAKRKRKSKRLTAAGGNKTKRLKMQQQQVEMEHIEQVLAESDRDVYEEDEEIFDCINVANGRLLQLPPRKPGPRIGAQPVPVSGVVASAPDLTAGLSKRSRGRLSAPVVAERSPRLVFVKSTRREEGVGQEKKTQPRKVADRLRQSLHSPRGGEVAAVENSPETRRRNQASSPRSPGKKLPVRDAARESGQTKASELSQSGETGLGSPDRTTRSRRLLQQQTSTDSTTRADSASKSGTELTTTGVRSLFTCPSIESAREIPGTPEDAVTPPGCSDEGNFGDSSAHQETSPDRATPLKTGSPSAQISAVTPKSTHSEMPRKTQNSLKTASMVSPPPPPPPSPPPPTVHDSPLLSLRFDIRKFPGDPKTISIHGGDIYDPITRFVSYDSLLALIWKDWPVDSEKQQLLMNWTFRLMDQEAFNHCIVQLRKHGRQMHEIVLCDLVNGKLPEGALKIQAGLKKADKFFWQGKLDAAPVKWNMEEIPKGKFYDDVRREAAGEAAAEKRRYTWGVEKWRNTAGASLHIKPNSPRRSPATPESEPPAKRRACEPVSTPITRSSGSKLSGANSTDRVASRSNGRSLMSMQTPGRWRQGAGGSSGAVGAVPFEKTPENEPLQVAAEALQNTVPADAEVGSKPATADAPREELESGIVQKAGVAKEIPTENIQPLDSESPDTSGTVPVEGYSSVRGSSVAPSQPPCKYPPWVMSVPLANSTSFESHSITA